MKKLKFDELSLSDEILQAVTDMGFVEASPIQSEAIPYIMEGRDVIGQAQTGTGKTAAFAIPALEMIDVDDKSVQTLVLCPTRELAVQVAEEFKKLGKYKKQVTSVAIYGGDSIEKQILALRRGVHVVIGTPGRVMDHMERKTLRLDRVKMVVLDEADEMLDMGFREDIESILEQMPDERQTIFFSATMSKPIMQLTKKYQDDPQLVKVVKNELTAQNIEQLFFEVKPRAKVEVMTRLIDLYNLQLMLVFCNTKLRVDEVVEELQIRGYQAEGLHGDLRQQQRNNVMAKFRAGTTTILVATDVAARGIDVEDVDAVFNFDIPLDEEYYVHRIGRTGRAGKAGKAFTFVVGREVQRLRDIQQYTKVKIQRGVIPSYEDIVGVKKAKFIAQIQEAIQEGGLEVFEDMIEQLHHAGLRSEQIITALIKMNMGVHKNEFADMDLSGGDDRGAGRERRSGDRERDRDRGPRRDRDSRDSKSTGRSRDNNRSTNASMVRLFINIGRDQKVRPGDIVGAIAGETGIAGNAIGSIDIYDKFTFVEVPKNDVQRVLKGMDNNSIKGQKVNIEIARQ
ncbi:DEAD/DEAH box helicase [Rhodocytophaga aerolata]|uniref:RNA helicase n=1 Tax=Rhodocytophaga aerolata TaxID=455078 RepID=A0ABT8RAB0_9BACT|nr:DEAD/DEAH box helicase [Rhodocytophaga aerolata]MDO1448138.1 DEAD/DEAH box helicase [Rhodocytophaga aerolata]